MKNIKIICNPAKINNVAMAIGNFDGVHIGHREIIRQAQEMAEKQGLPLAVMTFEPHPRAFFQKEKAPRRITPLRRKIAIFDGLGIELCYIFKFNRQFSSLNAEQFIEKFLIGNSIVTGQDFAFGANRGGDVALLQKVLPNYRSIAPVKFAGEVVSSSRIRQALMDGEIMVANSLLGYEFCLNAKVEHGAAKARELGFPTANLTIKRGQQSPKYGVYAVQTNFGAGVANFGVRPTLDGKKELLEVHIFDFNENLYGKDLQVKFIDYIREERFFSGVAELKQQIEKDVHNAKKILQ